MPCLSSSVFSALKASISVSKVESQLAVPLTITTFLDSSVVSWPKGSAVCTGAGVAAAAGGGAAGLGEALAAGEGEVAGDAAGDVEGLGEALAAGEGMATGAALAAGAGEADGAGEGLADAAGAGLGVWASVADRPNDKAAAGISAAKARRRNLNIFILPNSLSAMALRPRGLNPAARPGCANFAVLTRERRIRPMTDASWQRPGSCRQITGQEGQGSPYKAGEIREFS